MVDNMGAWWFKNLEKPAPKIDCGRKTVRDDVDDDAPTAERILITDSVTGTPIGSVTGPQKNKRQRMLALPYHDSDGCSKWPAAKEYLSEHNGHCYVKTRDGSSFCDVYSKGRCSQTTGGNKCWHDNSLAHQCCFCLRAGHTGAACWNNPANKK